MNYFRTRVMIVLVLLCLGVTVHAHNQDGAFFRDNTHLAIEQLNRDDGISNLSVSSIIQDKYGVFWFGTQDGLNRYDGRNVTVFKDQPFVEGDMSHNLIQTLYYDEENHELWIGTYNGVTHLNISERKFTVYRPKTEEAAGLSDPVIISIEKDRRGNMWFGTANGLDRLDLQTGEIVNYIMPGNVVRSLKETSDGTLLIGTVEGLLFYDDTRDGFEVVWHDSNNSVVMTIDEFSEGRISLGVWGTGIIDMSNDYQVLRTRSFDNNNIYATAMTDDDTFWIGTWGGGLFAETSHGNIYHLTTGDKDSNIVHDVVYSLCQDESGVLWVGTNGGGISIINPEKRDFVFASHDVDDPSSIDSGKINEIYEDRDGTYWIAVYGNGINHMNRDGTMISRYNTGLNNIIGDQVMDLMRDDEGRLLAATNVGLAFFDEERDQFIQWGVLPNNNRVYDILQTQEGIYWIGTYEEGVFSYDRSSMSLRSYDLSDKKVFSMLLDSKDRLWVGTNSGLNLLQPGEGTFKIYKSEGPVPGDLPSNTIEDIMEDSSGDIWFATNGGVAKYDEKRDNFIAYTEEQGLMSNNVAALTQCRQGIVWAATQKGISLIDEVNGIMKTLTPETGIGGWEFSNTAMLDSEGNLLFGGIHGVTRIPDEYDFDDRNSYPTYITAVKINDADLDSGEVIYNGANLNFRPDENFLRFDYITMNYDSPYDLTYEYRLIGLDDLWRSNGNETHVAFINIPAGDYRLELRSRLPNGSYTEAVGLDFRVEQHWYLQWYAFVVYVLLIGGFVYAIIEIRNARELGKRYKELDHLNVQLGKANKELEETSVMDSLTGLYNRRFMDMKLEEQVHLAKRSATNLSLIMVDMDNFKDINDTYGHVAGDKFLISIGQILQNNLHRSTDFACRYGGDEFMILLYDNSLDGALIVAERIRDQVRDSILEDTYSGELIRGTVSVGVISVVPEKETTPEDYIEAVDRVMYEAKAAGKNRISVGKPGAVIHGYT